jgi:hypothetical protein
MGVGIGGKAKTRAQLIVFWIGFSLFMGFIAYVVIKNM